MVKLAELEAAIIERLKPLEKSHEVKVMPFPDKANAVRPANRCQALVGFQGRTSTAPTTIDRSPNAPITQIQNINFEVTLELQDLRSHTGAYPIMDAIRDLLTGFRPADSLRSLYETTAGFVGQVESTWIYSLTYQLPEPYQSKRH